MAGSHTQELRPRTERIQRPLGVSGYVDLRLRDTSPGINNIPGRRVVELQTSQALVDAPQANQWPRDANGVPSLDSYGRKPYLHPALNGLQGLTDDAENMVLNKVRLSELAERYGLDKVTRWTPKRVCASAWTIAG